MSQYRTQYNVYFVRVANDHACSMIEGNIFSHAFLSVHRETLYHDALMHDAISFQLGETGKRPITSSPFTPRGGGKYSLYVSHRQTSATKYVTKKLSPQNANTKCHNVARNYHNKLFRVVHKNVTKSPITSEQDIQHFKYIYIECHGERTKNT